MRTRRGSIAVVVALSIVTLLASLSLGVDYGMGVLARHRLQKAVDAGALSSAISMAQARQDQAEDSGKALAQENCPQGEYVLSYPAAGHVRVFGTMDMAPLFSRLLGKRQITVRAVAEAVYLPASKAKGIRPFGVEMPDGGFEYGQTYTLKLGAGPSCGARHGNFHALALNGNGANVYRNNIKYGADVTINVGESVTTEPGNMSGPTEQGVSFLVGQDPHDFSYYQSSPGIEDSARLIIIPVVSGFENIHGRSEVPVEGFAAFFLEGVAGKGNNSVVSGRFVRMANGGCSGTPGSGGDYGVYAIRLIIPGARLD